MFSHWPFCRKLFTGCIKFSWCVDIEEFTVKCTSSSDLYSQQLLTVKPFPACIVSLGAISGELSHSCPTLTDTVFSSDLSMNSQVR